MAYFGNRLDGSTASYKQDVTFDASQYEFFGSNVAEYELEALNESIEKAPSKEAGNEDFFSPVNQKGKNVDPFSYVDDLTDSFTKLNQISKPKRPSDISERTSTSKQSIKNHVSQQLPKITLRQTGKIKWYNNQRGFGFIIPDTGGVELYVHCSYLKTDGIIHLSPGTIVEYESIPSFNGKMQAINVTAPNSRLLQDSRKKFQLPDLSTLIGTNMGLSGSYYSPGSGNQGALGPCFGCGKWGHISKDCPIRGRQSGIRLGELESGEGWSVKWCYICQSEGHVTTNCPWKCL